MRNCTEADRDEIHVADPGWTMEHRLRSTLDHCDRDSNHGLLIPSLGGLTHFLFVVLVLSAAALPAGCCSVGRSFAENQSYSITAVTVTRWDDYKATLQPSFTLKADDAVGKAMPTTSRVEDSFLNTFRANIKARVAPNSALQAGFGKPEETFAGTDLPTGLTGSTSTPTGTPQNPFSGNAGIDNNPFLTYLAATALYQEVQLLNRYITDANLADGYRPYVVQFLVNQDVAGPTQGFDTDITISFFGDRVIDVRDEGAIFDRLTEKAGKVNSNLAKQTALPGKTAEQQAALGEVTRLVDDVAKQFKQTAQQRNKAYEQFRDDISPKLEPDVLDESVREQVKEFLTSVGANTKLPLVLPMLVTDQIESSLRASRAEDLQQYALAVAAGYAGIGGEIDLEDVSRKIRSALRSDLNNRFSVSRVNANTVRVHFGARQVPRVGASKDASGRKANEYLADEGNHRMSAVILVPDEWVQAEPREIHFIATAHVTNAETGSRFDTSANRTVDQPLAELASKGGHPIFDAERLGMLGVSVTDQAGFSKRLGEDPDRSAFLAGLESSVRNNDYPTFCDIIDRKYEGLIPSKSQTKFSAIMNSLWHELSGLSIGSRYTTGSFWASRYLKPKPSFGDAASILALDDGKAVTLIIPGVKDLDPDRVRATWTLTLAEAPRKPVQLASLSAKAEGRSQLNMTFPSLKQLGLGRPEGGSTAKLQQELTRADSSGETTVASTNITVVYLPTGEGKPDGIEIRTPVSVLPAAKDVKLTLAVTETKDSPASIVGQPPPEPQTGNLGAFYRIEVQGARVDESKLPTFLRRLGDNKPFIYAIVGEGVGDLVFAGELAPGSKVSLTILPATGFAEEKAIELPVAAQKASP